MSELVVLGLKLLFLALLWLFVLFALNVVRTDLFGRRVEASPAADGAAVLPPAPARRDRRAAPLPTTLRVIAGPQTGVTVPLRDSILIGRTPDAGLVLDDPFMSTRHALLTRSGDGFVIEDLGSTNGTRLNEQPLTRPVAVTSADTIRIGRTSMVLEP